MRNRSIVQKLWLAFMGLVLVVLIPLELALDHLLKDFYGSQVTEPLLHHSHQLAHLLDADPDAIQIAPMMGHMVGGEVLVLDETGQPVEFPGRSHAPLPAGVITAALSGRTYTGQVTLPSGETYIITTATIRTGGGVVLLAPSEPLQQSLTLARRYLRVAAAITLLLGTGLALMLARGLLRPVIAIEKATRSIARGDFSTRVDVPSGDELGRLAAAVNQMTGQLEAYESRRREFLANVAHELRTPLSYIRGYTQAMAEGLLRSPEEQERYQRIVHEESIRIGRLVDDLMDLAQIEEGQMPLDLTPLDLLLPAEQAAATIRPLAEEKGVSIQVLAPADRPHVKADGGRIQQVIFNLLDNGLRYTPAGGTLTVTLEPGGALMTVRVTDTGPGIDTETLPLVFERFHKKHSSGRGLGLAIVRSIIRAHGGEVGAESPPGKGASFWFCLPAAT